MELLEKLLADIAALGRASPRRGETLEEDDSHPSNMANSSPVPAECAFVLRVYWYYVLLAGPEGADEPGLGGKLLYAGELDEDGRALIAAANIAGAASLCATADPRRQKQAIRDGIVDFVVTSLDEALRILKNEIRKRVPVAVCIAASPAAIEAQSAERGVAPDLLRPAGEPASGWMLAAHEALVVWTVSSLPAKWMPKLDAVALECLRADAGRARRWLRMAPGYLGRLAQSTHLVQADRAFASRFLERVKQLDDAPFRVRVSYHGGSEEFTSAQFNPADRVPSPSPSPSP